MSFRIGVDVGGTNTDAVLMDGDVVHSKVKASTTADVTSGITAAVRQLMASGDVSVDMVDAVMIGTTHFTNAFVEGRDLASVAIVRLCLPATQAVPPLIDWPATTRAVLRAETFWCHGGREFDGRRISEVRPDEIAEVAEQIGVAGLESVAVCGVYASMDPDDELNVAALLGAALPKIPISLSHQIGRIGLLERENATIINASLRPLAARTVDGFRDAIGALGIDAPVFVSQNDGTLGTLEATERYPVLTFTSGPTNSMRGAAHLSGVEDAAVVDIGGTTADIGMIRHRFPRETSVDAQIGGVRTNFRLPDVVSLGIGGGSVVDDSGRVGPRSVGHRIGSEAKVFGGSTLTATDVAVAGGRAQVGDSAPVAGLDQSFVRDVLEQIDERIADGVDRMRTSAADLPVILVGGGAVLVGASLPGLPDVRRPEHHEVANAVGSAMAQVGGMYEDIVSLATTDRAEAVAAVTEQARAVAIAAGADPRTLRVVDVDDVSLAYLPGHQTRIRVRVVGDLVLEVTHAVHR